MCGCGLFLKKYVGLVEKETLTGEEVRKYVWGCGCVRGWFFNFILGQSTMRLSLARKCAVMCGGMSVFVGEGMVVFAGDIYILYI